MLIYDTAVNEVVEVTEDESSPARAQTEMPPAGVVSPFSDFQNQQRAQLQQEKAKQRAAKEALTKPHKETYAAPALSSVEEGVVRPFSDFQTQQRMQLQEEKRKAREARESLNKPARPESTPKDVSNDAGLVSHMDFTMQQRAADNERKRKERLTKEALSSPTTGTYTPVASSIVEEGIGKFRCLLNRLLCSLFDIYHCAQTVTLFSRP